MSVVVRRLLNKNPKKLLNSIPSGVRALSNEANILNSGVPDIDIPKISIEEYVFEHLGKWEDRIATECAVTGRKYTYNQIRTKTNRLNRSLRKKLKLNRGDVVAILLPNVPEFPIAALGALKAGLTVTTLNPIYTQDEIARQLIDSSAKAIITLNDFWKLASASVQLTKQQMPILTIKTQEQQSTPEGAIDFAEFTDNDHDITDINDLDVSGVAALPYSSGTTGLPKGVELTHFNIVSNLCQLDDPCVSVCRITTENHQDVVPVVLPKFHIYGFTANCLHLIRRGNKIITIPKFTPDLYVSILKNHRPDILFLAPPLAIFLANHPSVTKDHLSSIRTIMSGAAPLGALDEARLLQKADKDIKVLQGYGMTETSPLVACSRHFDKKVTGSIGKACPNTLLKIVPADDPTGPALGPNQQGELLVKGPQVMKCYHNRPEETAKTFVDGWLRTGDMMYYDVEGNLFVTDRLKELLKVKGFQVAPAELEEVIRDFPNVADAAIIGIPHKMDGEVPKAYIVLKPNASVDLQELNEFINKKVAPYKQIKGGFCVVEGIPKNASGKIMRRELKAQYEKEVK